MQYGRSIPSTVTYNGNTNTGGTAPTDASSPYNYNSTVTTKPVGTLVKTGNTLWSVGTLLQQVLVPNMQRVQHLLLRQTQLFMHNGKLPQHLPQLLPLRLLEILLGGTTSILTGTLFLGTTSVTVGGVAVTSFVVNSATQITIVTPASSQPPGAKNVVITTPAGTVTGSTAGKQFTYQTTVTFNGNGNTGDLQQLKQEVLQLT